MERTVEVARQSLLQVVRKQLVLIASWVNDSLIIGSKKGIAIVKADLMSRFECDDCGEMQEYVG